MFGIIQSRVKSDILVFLGLRGGYSGRGLAKRLHVSPSQVFKALHQLETSKIILKLGSPSFYALNMGHPCHDELIRMITKAYQANMGRYLFLPKIREERRIDPEAVYEIIALRDKTITIEKFSDVLRKKYA